MTLLNSTPSSCVFVAIDVAKSRHEVLIERPDKKRRVRRTLLNIRSEHNLLIDELKALNSPITIGLEATGNYHRTIAWSLLHAGFDVRLISSVAMARTREALHNSWDKNDPKDTQVILHMLKIGASQYYHDPIKANINDIQELSKTHEVISRTKTETWHRLLTHYLPLYFPEAEHFKGSSRSDWFLAFLECFPTPSSIIKFSEDEFIEKAWDVVGRKVSKRQILSNIYAISSSSIALPISEDSPSIEMFRMVLSQARELIQKRDLIEKKAENLLSEDSDYKKLIQIPGIGPINALTILAEAGDIRRFRHHRQFLKYCGLDLATYQSGTFRGQSKLSKYGNARLRRTFWMAGQVAIQQKENAFRDKFERYISKDRNNKDLRRKAYSAITAKMARVTHAIIKNGKDYRPFFERTMPSSRTPLCRSRGGTMMTS